MAPVLLKELYLNGQVNKAKRLFDGVDQSLMNRFMLFHKNNPIVFQMFHFYALEAFNAGVNKISPWMLINRIRWHCQVETTGQNFSISNGYVALYSRMAVLKTPALEFYFLIKPLKSWKKHQKKAKK